MRQLVFVLLAVFHFSVESVKAENTNFTSHGGEGKQCVAHQIYVPLMGNLPAISILQWCTKGTRISVSLPTATTIVPLEGISIALDTIIASASPVLKRPVVIQYPNVIIESAGPNEHISLRSGNYGDIVLKTNGTNTVYWEGEDLQLFIKEVMSEPPVWEEHSPFEYLGTFVAGQIVSLHLHAKDPEGGHVAYKKVSGSFPPGVSLDSSSGHIHGLIPDAKALFKFTIRATDSDGKFADLPLKMVVQEKNNCANRPCQHEGACQDKNFDFRCVCVHPYGGKTCNIDCRNNYLGVDNRKRYIPDAQVTGYGSRPGYYPYTARLNQHGWIGINSSSWIQIDLGSGTKVYGSQMQGYSSAYYTSNYSLHYSLDGNSFHPFSGADGQTLVIK